jgi:glycosyltransferase involved in cell wall biosynthesis
MPLHTSDEAVYHVASWPAAPHPNQVIDRISAMLEGGGAVVHGANPVGWRTPFQRPDVFVIHWPDAIFWSRPHRLRLWFLIVRVLGNLALLRARGTRLVWFVHNLQPHDLDRKHRLPWRVYSRLLARLIHGWLTLAPSTGASASATWRVLACKPQSFVWHPPYTWPTPITREDARAALGCHDGAVIFAHVGLLRPYKNLEALIDAFDAAAIPGTRLTIAGAPVSTAYTQALDERVTACAGVELAVGGLSYHDYNVHLEGADVFVGPYSRFLHSGTLVHALCRGCVIVAPDVAFTRDLASAVGEEWVVTYAPRLTSRILATAAARARMLRGRRPDLSALAFERNAETLQTFVNALRRGHGVAEGTCTPEPETSLLGRSSR